MKVTGQETDQSNFNKELIIMAQTFKETAHLNIDREKYEENYDRIFGNKSEKPQEEKPTRLLENDMLIESSAIDCEWRQVYTQKFEDETLTQDHITFLLDHLVEVTERLEKAKGSV